MEVPIGPLLSRLDLDLVSLIFGFIKRSEEVLGMDTNSLSTLLTETERGDGESLDTIGLQRLAWVDNVIKLLHHLVDVVCITISWDKTRIEDLQTAVEHPGAGGTLWMTSQVFLEDTQESIALLATKMLHLFAKHFGLVLVVGYGGCTMERCNTKIVNRKAPRCQSTSQRGNARILPPEIVAQTVLSFLLLALNFSLDMLSSVLHILRFVEAEASLSLHRRNLFLQVH